MTTQKQVGEFTRQIDFRGGFNWLRDDPHQNYGVGSVKIAFVLIGKKGAVNWIIGTEWFPQAARDHLGQFPRGDIDNLRKPIGFDLGYHAKEPQYEGHPPLRDHCEFTGGQCYYDGSALAADELIEGFLNGGDEWVWTRLEAYYRHLFDGADYPDFTPMIQPHPAERKLAS